MTIQFIRLLRTGTLLVPLCTTFGVVHADVVISSGATTNMNCVSGTCTPTSPNAVLNVGDLQTMLASGNVTITGSAEPVDIDIEAAFSWSSVNSLTLDSYHSINVASPVAVTGTGGLSIVTNDGGTGGWFTFAPNANAEFSNLTSSLSINQAAYILVSDIKTLASDIAANPSGNFALASDYNASPDGTYSTAPITTDFMGNFQGLGNVVSDLKISGRGEDAQLGLFAFALTGSAISNVVMQNASVIATAGGASAGILTGNTEGTLSGDHTSGKVSVLKSAYAGGLAAQAATVIGSSSSATVSAKDSSVIGGLLAGGITVDRSFATGTVKLDAAGMGGAAGGLVVSADTLTNSYATGTVKGTGGQVVIGGLVGVGGADGEDQSISTSYSTGYLAGVVAKGGFAGKFGTTVTASDDYWDTQTSGTEYASSNEHTISGVTGVATKKLKAKLPAGFDPTIWAQSKSINNGFPYLIANPPQ